MIFFTWTTLKFCLFMLLYSLFIILFIHVLHMLLYSSIYNWLVYLKSLLFSLHFSFLNTLRCRNKHFSYLVRIFKILSSLDTKANEKHFSCLTFWNNNSYFAKYATKNLLYKFYKLIMHNRKKKYVERF